MLNTIGHDPVCHVMAGSYGSISNNGPEEQEMLTRPYDGRINRPEAIDQLREKVTEILPDATMKEPFVYGRQRNDDFRKNGGYGKGAILFEPQDNGNAVVKVYNTGVEVEHMEWLYQEIQIWRMNVREAVVANVALQADRNKILDACEDVKTPVKSNHPVELGSEDLSVGEHLNLKFAFLDKDEEPVTEDCYFVGEPYGRFSDGAFAGELRCKDRTIRCTRPLTDPPGRSCNDKNPPNCGKLGVNCAEGYNELLAICRH